jgi:hypothetical protein
MIDVVTNMTKDYSRNVFDIRVAYREDVGRGDPRGPSGG